MMFDYVLVGVCVSLLTISQLLQKRAASHARAPGSVTARLLAVLGRSELWGAVGCLGLGTLIWLVVLYRTDVSRAFPFLSLVLVAVALLSRLVLHESVSPTRWLGVATIGAGVMLVAAT